MNITPQEWTYALEAAQCLRSNRDPARFREAKQRLSETRPDASDVITAAVHWDAVNDASSLLELVAYPNGDGSWSVRL